MANNENNVVRYPVNTLQDFLKIPPDRLDTCLDDFKRYLEMLRPLDALTDFAKFISEDEGEPIDEEVIYGPFIWIDDGMPPATNAVIDLSETDDGGMEIKIRTTSPDPTD